MGWTGCTGKDDTRAEESLQSTIRPYDLAIAHSRSVIIVPRVDPKTLREITGLILKDVANQTLSAMGAIPFEPTPHTCGLTCGQATVA